MLVIVTSRRDREARELADRWAAHDARVLSCEDLSLTGWRHYPGAPGDSVAVVGGTPVPVAEITGALTRRPRVFEWEPARATLTDRPYVAAEMTAFLRCWLAGLECPVLNRPAANCLSGPGWRREQAVHVAAGLGIPVRPAEWRIEPSADVVQVGPAPPGVTVTVVGDGCVGYPDRTLATQARRLADAAGVDLLAVRFEETEAGFWLCDADPWPDVSSPEVADAILSYFRDGCGC